MNQGRQPVQRRQIPAATVPHQEGGRTWVQAVPDRGRDLSQQQLRQARPAALAHRALVHVPAGLGYQGLRKARTLKTQNPKPWRTARSYTYLRACVRARAGACWGLPFSAQVLSRGPGFHPHKPWRPPPPPPLPLREVLRVGYLGADQARPGPGPRVPCPRIQGFGRGPGLTPTNQGGPCTIPGGRPGEARSPCEAQDPLGPRWLGCRPPLAHPPAYLMFYQILKVFKVYKNPQTLKAQGPLGPRWLGCRPPKEHTHLVPLTPLPPLPQPANLPAQPHAGLGVPGQRDVAGRVGGHHGEHVDVAQPAPAHTCMHASVWCWHACMHSVWSCACTCLVRTLPLSRFRFCAGRRARGAWTLMGEGVLRQCSEPPFN